MNQKVKKIGMVTFYSDNFGSCLQAYALYKTIMDIGYAPKLIRYTPYSKGRGGRNNDSKLYKLTHLPIKSTLHILLNYRMVKGRKAAFDNFRKNSFQFTSATYSKNADTSDLESQFDVFICGSDMMWAETFHEDWEQYFLRFASEGKRVSYAPSFGINQISTANINRCREYLEGFRPGRLSCRDLSGVKMIQEEFGLEAQHVVDPTMLLDKGKWNRLVDAERMIKRPYVLLYLFGGHGRGRKQLLHQVEEWKLGDLKSLAINGDYCFRNPHIGPLEFVRLFRDAEFIVTDTFHGMVFSLIYEKPFVVLSRNDGLHWSKYSDRMTAQLDMLGIPERWHEESALIPETFKTLDYKDITSKLSRLRHDSLAYLKNALDSVLSCR